MSSAGFGTIEAIVATAIFATIAAALSSTLILARRLQSNVAVERSATALAAAALERMRAGGDAEPEHSYGRLTVTESLRSWNGQPQLLEASVRVAWNDGLPRHVELKTLLKR